MPNDAICGKLDTGQNTPELVMTPSHDLVTSTPEPAKHPLSETAGVRSQEVVSKFSRHLPSMEKHYDVFKVPRVYIEAYSSYHTVYLFLVDPTTLS